MKKTLIVCMLSLPLLGAIPAQASCVQNAEYSFCMDEQFTAAQIAAIINEVQPAYYDKFGLSVEDIWTLYEDETFVINDLGGGGYRTSYGNVIIVGILDD